MNSNNKNAKSNKMTSKALSKSNNKKVVEERFYRKVQANAKMMAEDIFKQGLNLIIIQRNEDYDKRKIIFIINIINKIKNTNKHFSPSKAQKKVTKWQIYLAKYRARKLLL